MEWILEQGGLAWAEARTRETSGVLYDWEEAHELATPFVADPAMRSPVVGTIDFEGVAAETIAAVLRANGIVFSRWDELDDDDRKHLDEVFERVEAL